MLTAINGILIVVLLFWWGVHIDDKGVMALALTSALCAWVSNFCLESESLPQLRVFAASAAGAAVGLAVVRSIAIAAGY